MHKSNFHGDASLEKRSVVVPDICHQLSHPSFSVAINIPLCCLSQNYRNLRRMKMVGEQRDRGTTKPNSRQFATRIESQTAFNAFRDSSIPLLRFLELNRRGNRCNANNIIPSLVPAASSFSHPSYSHLRHRRRLRPRHHRSRRRSRRRSRGLHNSVCRVEPITT